MRIALRAALRLALTGCLGLALLAPQGRAATAPEKVLPDSTFLFLKINNAASFRESFGQSQFGQLWNDAALRPLKESFAEKIDDAGKGFKQKLGITINELLNLPQGTVAIAFVPHDDPKVPPSLVLTFDVGTKLAAMTDVLTKASKQAEEDGAKVETQEFKGQKFTVIYPPKKEAKKDDKTPDVPQPPLVWTHHGPNFTITSDVDLAKDLIANAEGREASLAATEAFAATQRKIEEGAQVTWYVDAVRFLKIVTNAGAAARGNAAQAQQAEAMFQVTGVNGLKAIAGSFVLNKGSYDSVSKMIVYAPAPTQGLLKVFQLPKVALKPEPWVPASIYSYRTISWNLDSAFTAINDLVNMFQPGVLQVMEQQLVGPNGGEPLSFQKDVFGPLGNRVTIISDFKKPVKEDSERSLIGIHVDDPKKFQNTLTKLIALGGEPKKREFQGTTIYDFEMPDVPNANAENMKQFKGPLSVALTKNTLFASNEPTLLESVLRGNTTPLADSSAYQAVAKEFPDQVSGMSYMRPDENARVTYDMIKSGQFEKALQGAAVAGGPDLSKATKLIDKDKLPDFAVVAKYLAQGGGYSLMDEDGVTFTTFTLRKEKP